MVAAAAHEEAEGCIDVSFRARAHCHRGFRVWLHLHMKVA